MNPVKLLSIFFFLLIWQGCQQHEDLLNQDKPKYEQIKIDPTKNGPLMDMLSSTLSGVTNSNGRMMSSPIGNINLDEALRVEHFANDIVRYTFNIESIDGLMISNLIIKENADGEFSGYIVHYQPNIDWLISQGTRMNFKEFTGHIVFAYLDGQDYYVTKVASGIGHAYAFPNLEHANGRMPGDCNGQGGDGLGGTSSGGDSGFYDQYGGDYTWSSSEVAYIGGASNDPGGNTGEGGTGSKVNDTPTLEIDFEPPPVDAITRRPCTPDGFYESCTNDTSVDAADEACETVPIGVLNEDIDLSEYFANFWEENKVCTTDSFDNNSCISGAWEKLKSQNSAFELLRNFNSENPTAKLCMDVKPTLGTDGNGNKINGQTNGSTDPIQIDISAEQAAARSQIEVARTIFHELIHAEMLRKINSVGGVGQINPSNFPGLFDYYSRYVKIPNGSGGYTYPDGTPQHNLMANHYIGMITDALMEFDGNTTNRNYYEALAWDGLKQTEVWDNKPVSEKEAIEALSLILKLSKEKCQ